MPSLWRAASFIRGAFAPNWRFGSLVASSIVLGASHYANLSRVGAFICGAWAQRKVPFIKKGALVKWSICGAEALSVVWRLCELGRQYSINSLRRGSLGVSIMWHRGSSGAFWCLCGASTLLLIKWALQVAFFW